MNKVELAKVLDLLIAEDKDEAGKLLHEWFVGKSKTILEELMQEDDDALDSIKDDQDEIKSEEFYGDADLAEGEGEEGDAESALAQIADIADDFVGDEAEVDEADEDGLDDFGGEGDVDAEVDADVDGDIDAAADDLGDEMGAEEMPIEDKVDDLEAQLAQLKAEFDSLMGSEGEDDAADLDADVSDEEGVEESIFEGDDEDLDESDDFENLEESFELEKVADPDMSEGSEAGNGGKMTVGKVSPIPQRKTGDRVGGNAVEMKGKTHSGYAREASPSVNSKPILKNQVKNAKSDLKGVSPEGDKSALLNKGPKADKGKSPIGGGATDLRGDDMKRK